MYFQVSSSVCPFRCCSALWASVECILVLQALPPIIQTNSSGIPTAFSIKPERNQSRRVHRTLFRRRQWHPTPVLLPRKPHGRRSLVQATAHEVAKSRTFCYLIFFFSIFTDAFGHVDCKQIGFKGIFFLLKCFLRSYLEREHVCVCV